MDTSKKVLWRCVRAGQHEATDRETGEYLGTIYAAGGAWAWSDRGGLVEGGLKGMVAAKNRVEQYYREAGMWQ